MPHPLPAARPGRGAAPVAGAGLTPGPTDNFQDQMKRELAYREEMVQQLQIVRGKAEPLSTFIFFLIFFFLFLKF